MLPIERMQAIVQRRRRGACIIALEQEQDALQRILLALRCLHNALLANTPDSKSKALFKAKMVHEPVSTVGS